MHSWIMEFPDFFVCWPTSGRPDAALERGPARREQGPGPAGNAGEVPLQGGHVAQQPAEGREVQRLWGPGPGEGRLRPGRGGRA